MKRGFISMILCGILPLFFLSCEKDPEGAVKARYVFRVGNNQSATPFTWQWRDGDTLYVEAGLYDVAPKDMLYTGDFPYNPESKVDAFLIYKNESWTLYDTGGRRLKWIEVKDSSRSYQAGICFTYHITKEEDRFRDHIFVGSGVPGYAVSYNKPPISVGAFRQVPFGKGEHTVDIP